MDVSKTNITSSCMIKVNSVIMQSRYFDQSSERFAKGGGGGFRKRALQRRSYWWNRICWISVLSGLIQSQRKKLRRYS